MHDLTETQAATLIEQGYRGGIAATSPDPLYVPRSIAASQLVRRARARNRVLGSQV